MNYLGLILTSLKKCKVNFIKTIILFHSLVFWFEVVFFFNIFDLSLKIENYGNKETIPKEQTSM